MFTGSEILSGNERVERRKATAWHCWHHLVAGFAQAHSPEVVGSLLFFAGWLLILCGRWLLLLLFTFCRLVTLFPLVGYSVTASINGVAWLLLFHFLYGQLLSFATPKKGEERNRVSQWLLDPRSFYCPFPEGETTEDIGEDRKGRERVIVAEKRC